MTKKKQQTGVIARAHEDLSMAGTPPRTPGFLKGKITIRPNFNAPLELAPLTPLKKKKHTQYAVPRLPEDQMPMTHDKKKMLAAPKKLNGRRKTKSAMLKAVYDPDKRRRKAGVRDQSTRFVLTEPKWKALIAALNAPRSS